MFFHWLVDGGQKYSRHFQHLINFFFYFQTKLLIQRSCVQTVPAVKKFSSLSTCFCISQQTLLLTGRRESCFLIQTLNYNMSVFITLLLVHQYSIKSLYNSKWASSLFTGEPLCFFPPACFTLSCSLNCQPFTCLSAPLQGNGHKMSPFFWVCSAPSPEFLQNRTVKGWQRV